MLYLILNYLKDLLRPQHDLFLENLALRQQILVLERQVKRPNFKDRERTFWVILSRKWPGWRTPWQNGYRERVVGTIKPECLNHMIILSEGHAHRVLKKYFEYYHDDRTHLGLEKDAPSFRAVEPPKLGPVKRRAVVGGLHSRYYRDAA